MPRGLSAAAKTYEGPIVWLAEITTRAGVAHYFATQDVVFGGNAYLPYLRVTGAFRLNRTMQADAGEIELINTDLVIGNILETQDFEGALCVIRKLLLGIDEAVHLGPRWLLTEQEQSESAVKFRLVSELDAANIRIPVRDYANLCTWRFGSSGATPLNAGPCRYRENSLTFVENLAERTANIFSRTTIGDSTLAMTVDEHKDRWVVIGNGTGKGQKRQVRSNTATTFTLYNEWATLPDGTSTFRAYSFTNGAPVSFQNNVQHGITSGAARSATNTFWNLTTDEHKNRWLRIVSGTGSGQRRRIGSNTATVITIAATEADFSPVPDATSVIQVLFDNCPKDYASCEDRARNQDFNGFPTVIPAVAAAAAVGRGGFQPDPQPPPGDGGGGGGGGGGGLLLP